jgi:hypothetical protein
LSHCAHGFPPSESNPLPDSAFCLTRIALALIAAGCSGKTVDNAANLRLFRRMAQPETKLTSPASLALDAVLVIGFFLFIYSLVSTHVPSNDKRMILLWGGLGTSCMTGVFWLCVQMFRVVLRAQRSDRRKE